MPWCWWHGAGDLSCAESPSGSALGRSPPAPQAGGKGLGCDWCAWGTLSKEGGHRGFLLQAAAPSGRGPSALPVYLSPGGKQEEQKTKTKTNPKRTQTQTSLTVAGQGGTRGCWHHGRGCECRERAPGTSVARAGSLERKTGTRQELLACWEGSSMPSPSSGSPRGPRCAFSSARRKAERGTRVHPGEQGASLPEPTRTRFWQSREPGEGSWPLPYRLLCVRALLRAVDGTQVPVPSCPLLAPGALSHRGR